MRPRRPRKWGLTTPQQQRTGVRRLVMLAAIILGLTLATRPPKDEDRADAADMPDTPPEEVRVTPPNTTLWDEGEGPDRSTLREGAREAIPRVAEPSDVPPPSEDVQPVVEPEAEAEPAELGARPLATAETIQAAVAEVVPDIEDCLHQWWMVQPDLEGRIVLELQLYPEGLRDAVVLDHDGVPAAVMGCFSGALYDADWPEGEVDGTVITYPFVFDAGSGEDSG